ncbi:MAG: SDR family oxidoreductase [Gammaproteobacteria bacterium]|nr:SDR family oxidoreductase [Gammaproteobacteria bacterium]
MSGRLAGRTALITGGSRGIGLAVAEACAAEGAGLVLNARDATRLEAVAADLRRRFGVAVAVHAGDVTDRAAMAAMVEQAEAAGGIDVLVNNAGIHRAAAFLDYDAQDFRDLFEVNFIGVLHVTQLVLPGMVARGAGSIVNLASTAGKWGTPNQAAYNVSKHAVIGLTRCLALELAAQGVRVNAVCPWVVDTDMATSFITEHARVAGLDVETTTRNFVNSVPLKRFIRPEEVASLVVYLACDEASYVNGQSWAVDGGRTMI